jgi:D-cysteine desulfhydrase
LNRFPRVSLGTFPSPVRRETLDNGSHFWIKDDGGCCEIYGGNKVRKLEYLLADAQRNGKRILVVHGDIESHTVQACGLLGRKLELEVHAVVFPHRGQSFDAPELVRLKHAGVHVHPRRSMLTTILHAHWAGWRMNACVVPLGASTPVATLGYVQAALELLEQVRQGHLPEPRRIYLPFATGGSVAGLLVGLALADAKTRVVAVRTVESVIANRRRLERLVKGTLELLGLDRQYLGLCLHRLELIDSRQLGRGYRATTSTTKEAVAIAATHDLSLDPVFSGKAFASMLDALPGFPDGDLLFWNTHDQQHGPTKAEANR